MSNNLFIGPSIELGNTLYETIQKNQYYTCQFTLTKTITKADKLMTIDYCKENNCRFYIHSHLTCNLAKNDASNTVRSLKKDLSLVKDMDAAVVLHVGKTVDQTSCNKRPNDEERIKAIDNIVCRLNDLENYTQTAGKPLLLLENSAGQGREIGDTWDDFRKISEKLNKNYLGICIDTQHSYASGLCKWETYLDTNKIIDEAIASGFPVELIHLNDSLTTFASKVDRHASFGDGNIWKDNQESLIELLIRCMEESKSIVLETPNQDKDLKYIYSKINC